MNQKVDYIIVGQGLAGSVLAYKLLQKGKSVFIIDESKGETASKKASGLINPITGRRFVKSWKIDELMPCALKFYSTLEKELKTNFFQQTKVHRILQSIEQQNDWASKTKDERYAKYLKSNEVIFHAEENIKNPFGCIEVAPVFKINTPHLIDALSLFFEEKNILHRTKFDYEKLEFSDTEIVYDNLKASKIIFCEGSGVRNNPWFKDFPFMATKGEMLWFEAKDLPEDFIIGGSSNITPLGNHQFSIGSTYDWGNASLEPTQEKKKELIEKLENMISCNYTITRHDAGVRPTVKDRRPVLGVHPDYKNLYVFNGLGTKGLSLAPYFAEAYVAFLEANKSLNEEIALERFQ